MVNLNIFSALSISLISLTGASAITLEPLHKRAYQNATSCIATTETTTTYSPYTVYGSPYSGEISNQYTTPELASEWQGSSPVFSIYVAQEFYNISDFSLTSTYISSGFVLSESDIKIYTGDVDNFVQVSTSIFDIESKTNNSISISLNGRTNDPLLRIDIPTIILTSEKTYSASFLLVLDSLTTKLAKRDELTFELNNTFINPSYVSSTTSGASSSSSSSSSSSAAPSSQITGISSTTSSTISSSTESAVSSSDSTGSAGSSSVSSTGTDLTGSAGSSSVSSSVSSTDIDPTGSAGSSSVSSSVSSTDIDPTGSAGSSSVSSTALDPKDPVESSSHTTASSEEPVDPSTSSTEGNGPTITAKSTITETITSCSDNSCHTTTQKAIISDTTLTIDGTVTVVETTCPVSEDQTLSTSTESTTVTEVVTSCSDNKCTSFTWTAVPSTYATTILDVVYTLTTYCPVGSNPAPSPAVNVGGGASVAVAAVSETVTIGETETVISTICTLSSGVAVETIYTTTTAANGQVEGTAVVHTFSEFIASPSNSALDNMITAVTSSSTSTAISTQSSKASPSVEVYSENAANGMSGKNSFNVGSIAAVIGLVMLL